MRRRLALGLVSLLVAAPASRGEYNYHAPTELLLSLGTQALMSATACSCRIARSTRSTSRS